MRRLIAAGLIVTSMLMTVNGQSDWRTKAERTNLQETSRYDETIDYCKRLDAASPWVTYTTFGRSPEGRDLPLLIVSKDASISPEAAHKAGRAVVLIQNGIHAGEIAGKEASLALVREIAITKSLAALVDNVVLLVVPIFNVDGHERFGPYNRINQNGPVEMGWRTTSQNLNLNRDYMKLDAPEMRAMVELFNAWRPDLYMDNHVTDGADYQYDLLYTLDARGDVAPSVATWISSVFQPHVKPALEREGHVVDSYFELVDEKDVRGGVAFPLLGPRYSNGYGALRNRPTILVETHMLKTFGQRLDAHYDLMVETLRELNRDPASLRDAVSKADQAASSIKAGDEVVLEYKLADKSRTMTFRGNKFRHERSDVSGDVRVIYEKSPNDYQIEAFSDVEPKTTVRAPRAYLIPSTCTDVIERLARHGVRLQRVAETIGADVEAYRLNKVSFASGPFEGRHRVTFEAVPQTANRQIPAGTVVVQLDQPLARLVIHLLEPSAPDSFAAWGFFNAFFEQKEYGEHYAVESLARDMLAKDPALAAEFDKRLREDPAFRGSPEARLDFFFRRSPYMDSRKDVYPVLRLGGVQSLKTVAY